AFCTGDAWALSGSFNSLLRTRGTICQDTPNRSVSQPHGPFDPPSESFSQNMSTSSWFWQSTMSDIPCENSNEGPPLRATNSCPSSSKFALMRLPFAPGPASPYRLVLRIREFLKMEV